MSNSIRYLDYDASHHRLLLTGEWNINHLIAIKKSMNQLQIQGQQLIIDGKELTTLDTAAAWYLDKFCKTLKRKKIHFRLENFQEHQKKILDLASKHQKDALATSSLAVLNPFAKIGFAFVSIAEETLAWLHFIGEVFVVILFLLRHPSRIRWKYLAHVVENNGYQALPIIGFLTFLIGVVLTYQIGLQLKTYGANIFIINLLGLAILREFGPLITAIILTGRTGSAFTAQLGLMKANEEIDALSTMGLSPTEFLVLPRIFGLMICVPLLTVWADAFGTLGGMFMSKAILDINYLDFLQRFPGSVTLTTFMIGMIKAPVFAMIVASVGCFHGFRVSGSSESIGEQTTRSVVMAIFMIIIADAAFSVILSWMDI